MVVLGIEQVEQSVKEKRQEIAGGEKCREMLRAMAEVVFEMVTLRFERLGIFLLYFPPRAPCRHERRNGVGGEGELSHERGGIELGSCRSDEGEFTPIHVEGSGAGA